MSDSFAWGRKVPKEFVNQLRVSCASIGGVNPYWSTTDAIDDLMTCIAFETACTFRPDTKNMAGSGATGLIQFMPSTAKGLGTTTEELSKMSAVQQLKYVFMYFKPYANKIRKLEDMYMAILMPKYVASPLEEVVFSAPGVAYRQNSGFDRDKDGKITKGEICARIRKHKELGLSDQYRG